jgi:ABC-type Fe3+-siderophore transport system permease subunit
MFILHSGMEWLAAGIVGFVGLIISCALWWIVMKIHGNGTAVGAMTATVIMLLFDLIGLPLIKLFRR